MVEIRRPATMALVIERQSGALSAVRVPRFARTNQGW